VLVAGPLPMYDDSRCVLCCGQVPAGFNHFQFPMLINNFYGVGIPFKQVQEGGQITTTAPLRTLIGRQQGPGHE
jgi:hypothetical protein